MRETLHRLTICPMATTLCCQLLLELLHVLSQGLTPIFLDGRRLEAYSLATR